MTTNDTTSPATATALPLRPGRWVADPTHSSIGFAIRHLGLSKVRGRFQRFEATLVVGETPADLGVTAAVETASIDTGNADRDAHVKTPELLDVERLGTMRFASTAIRGAGEDWTMEGTLTIGDVTRPITFPVEFGGVSELMGQQRAGFSTSGQISRKELGLDFTMPGSNAMLGDAIRFEVDLELLAPDPA